MFKLKNMKIVAVERHAGLCEKIGWTMPVIHEVLFRRMV